jgi:GntR family transcriptional regulator, transcriptional repressor for pyruvate dehydrogenase complex
MHLLEARRVLEREAARPAAERLNPADLRSLESVLEAQEAEIEQGRLGLDEDIQFHVLLARASGNPYLERLVFLLRHHGQYGYLVTAGARDFQPPSSGGPPPDFRRSARP